MSINYIIIYNTKITLSLKNHPSPIFTHCWTFFTAHACYIAQFKSTMWMNLYITMSSTLTWASSTLTMGKQCPIDRQEPVLQLAARYIFSHCCIDWCINPLAFSGALLWWKSCRTSLLLLLANVFFTISISFQTYFCGLSMCHRCCIGSVLS